MAATTPRFAAIRLLQLHRHQHYHGILSNQFYHYAGLATRCRLGVSNPGLALAPALAIHSLQRFMSSPTSRTAIGEPKLGTQDEGSAPLGYTGEEWEAASSDAAKLQLMFRGHPEGRPSRWGWVIYRTAYQPELDGAWVALQDLVKTRMRDVGPIHYGPDHDAPVDNDDVVDVIDKMDWVFVQDAAALDGISRDALRRQFQTWVVGEAPDLAAATWARGARYEYFLQADEDALRSILQPPVVPGVSYVNIVQAWPFVPPADKAFDADGEPIPPEDWMKMALAALHPSNYIEMDDPESWYINYCDPAEGGVWMY